MSDFRTILAEMADYGDALMAEHDKRICEHQAPAVQSSYVAQSVAKWAGDIAAAVSDALTPLRQQVEQVEAANRDAGYVVPSDALFCLPYREARALLDALTPPGVRGGE